MGLFDFILGKGRKLEMPPVAPQARQVSPEELQRLKDAKRAELLAKFVADMGFKVDGLSISLAGSTATVAGKVASQELREKVVLAIGNHEGIAKVDDRLEVVAAEPAAVFYTVKSGDTLSKIAKQYLGKASDYPKIFEANKPLLSDPDKIYPGQVLRIPGGKPPV